MITALVAHYFNPKRIYLGQTSEFLNITLSIESLIRQEIIDEIIIIDQKSPHGDEESHFLKKTYSDNKKVRIISLNHKIFTFNKSWLINIGIQEAETDHIMVSDIDCIVEPRFSEIISHFLRKENNFLITSDVYGILENHINWLQFNIEVDFYKTLNKLERRQDQKTESNGPGNIIFLKETAEEIHGLDERFELHGQEDSDFYRRLWAIGKAIEKKYKYKIIHQPHVITYCGERLMHEKLKMINNSPKMRNQRGWGEKDFPRT